jgi:hypothetical protein
MVKTLQSRRFSAFPKGVFAVLPLPARAARGHFHDIDGATVPSPISTEETMNIRNLILAAAIAVATASSPALAASHHNSRAGFNAFGAAQDVTDGMSTDRAQALRDCNDATSKMRDYTWGVTIGQNYRVCMQQHGQPE